MPELPEVETVRRQLHERITGTTIVASDIFGPRTVRRQSPLEFTGRVVGRRVEAAKRWGKFLLLVLSDSQTIVIHLRMSGQLSFHKERQRVQLRHTHAVFQLSSGGELCFIDPRTFGEVFVTEKLDGRGVPDVLAHLGMDPILECVDRSTLDVICRDRRLSIKSLLLDQRHIAGIGNIYGDEICFLAKVRPDRESRSLDAAERARVAVAMREVLTSAIDQRGSSLRDRQYRDLDGALGAYQELHRVYARSSLACYDCGTPIERLVRHGRSSHLCPSCQR